MKIKTLFIFGTRPEAIKMAPVINLIKKESKLFDFRVCFTAQHREMLDQVVDFFSIKPDYDLNLMQKDQTLSELTSRIIKELGPVFDDYKPDVVFVQGDTTTALIGALSAYYSKTKIAHIEAGLRSFDKYSPFPEEINRKLVGHMADYHFAPTESAKKNLSLEGINKNVYVVGNTVVDALFWGLKNIKDNGVDYVSKFSINFNKKVILVTGHRRESFGKSFEDICLAIKKVADKFDDVEILYPVHLNPNVRVPVNKILAGNPRIHLIEPVDYPTMISMMSKSYLILTDSGGVQEEAPSLGKPVLVMRDVTERQEGITAGTAKLVGTKQDAIFDAVSTLLLDQKEYDKMSKTVNPYGDGTSSQKILEIIKSLFLSNNER